MNLNKLSTEVVKTYTGSCLDPVYSGFSTLTGLLWSGQPLDAYYNNLYNQFGYYAQPLTTLYTGVSYGVIVNGTKVPFTGTENSISKVTITSAYPGTISGTYTGYTTYNSKLRYKKNNPITQEIAWSGNKWVIVDYVNNLNLDYIYYSNDDVKYPWLASWTPSWKPPFNEDYTYYPYPYPYPIASLAPNNYLPLTTSSGNGFFNINVESTGIDTGFYVDINLQTSGEIFSQCISNTIPLLLTFSGFTQFLVNKFYTPSAGYLNSQIPRKVKLAAYTNYSYNYSGLDIDFRSGMNFTISNPGVLPIDFIIPKSGASLDIKPILYDNNCHFTGNVTKITSGYVNLDKVFCDADSEAENLKNNILNNINCDSCNYNITMSLPCPNNSVTTGYQSGNTIINSQDSSFVNAYVSALNKTESQSCDNCYYMNTGSFYTGDQAGNLYNWSVENCNVVGTGYHRYGEDLLGNQNLKRDLLKNVIEKSNFVKCLEDDPGCCPDVGCDYAYVGFGAATGGGREKHEILAFSFQNIYNIISFNQDFYKNSINLVGDAYISGDQNSDTNSIVLTDDEFWQGGNFYLKKPIKFRDCNGNSWNSTRVYPFRVYFAMRMTPGADPGLGRADGITFIIQSQSDTAGEEGGGMGYAGISNSIAIGFDTYNNNLPTDLYGENNQISQFYSNNVEINLNGIEDIYGESVESVQQTKICNLELADGQIKHVWVDYTGGTAGGILSVYISNSATKPLNPSIVRTGMDLCEVFPNCECATLTPAGTDSNCANCVCSSYAGTYGGYLVSSALECATQGKYPVLVNVGDNTTDFALGCFKDERTCYECYTIANCNSEGYYEDDTDCGPPIVEGVPPTTTTTTTTTTTSTTTTSATTTPSNCQQVSVFGFFG